MAKRFRASVAGACHPLTDGSFADAKGLGNLALGPALLFEMPGLEPSGFSPVVGCRVHAWEYSTDPSRALDLYTRLSNRLDADVVTLARALRLAERELALGRHAALLPESLDGFVINTVAQLVKDNAGQFSVLKPGVEALEPLQFLHHGRWHPSPSPRLLHLHIGGEQPQHALLFKLAFQLPDGFRMGVGLLGPCGRCAVSKEYQRPDELIAPLDLIHEVELKLGKVLARFHQCPPPSCGSCLSGGGTPIVGPNIEKLPYGATCGFSGPDRCFEHPCGANFAEKDG